MSPALADLPLRKVLNGLSRASFEHVRTKGSHAVYRNPAGLVVVVPQHATSSAAPSPPSFARPG
ncbi:type II toxin-antitoxin system HicA family toxin [Micromonospora sp. RP3T]|uniref:type II toxin-antitoxin system HicA family toxin n=1 Tax=Micromonospora sp. RP3T TaxID=2135446 RepID=UPI003D765669